MNPPIVQHLFGRTGAAFQPILESLAASISEVKYTFLEEEDYKRLAEVSPEEGMRVYWEEMLFRVHWAATCAILRHRYWHDACLQLFSPRPNFLGFAAALRGLLEASADSFSSLRAVPMTLAQNQQIIKEALRGASPVSFASEELEDLLIHFHYARRLDGDEPRPDSHKQETACKYIQSIDGPNSTAIKRLYSELCQLAHPSAYSVL